MNRSDRLVAYLSSKRNLVGSAFGLGGLALFAAGVTGGLLWLPITAGLYLVGALVVPPEKGLDVRLGGAQDISAVRSGLDHLVRDLRGRIADDLYAKVGSIRDSILATLPKDGAIDGVPERDVYLIRQTALDYLPAALNAYLALPRRYAERRLVNGRTPHDVLLDQLDLMDRKMSEVADDIARQDTDRLLAHGRFLQEKFAGSALSLAQGGSLLPTADTAPTPTPSATAVSTPTTAATPTASRTAAEDVAAERERERVHGG